MVNKCVHLYWRMGHSVYCKTCGVEFIPKLDISRSEFDAAFDHYFKALDELLKVKKEKSR